MTFEKWLETNHAKRSYEEFLELSLPDIGETAEYYLNELWNIKEVLEPRRKAGGGWSLNRKQLDDIARRLSHMSSHLAKWIY